ncbi:MAG: hypothetical protein CL454_00330 [Acidimicrobiaceae bacterium]|nr:hypothetical protein [Acidimicrobiaceae bacterium]
MAEFMGLNVRRHENDPNSPAVLSFVEQYSTIDPAEHARICQLDQHHPETNETNEEWLAARKYRFTGSTAGAACHQNPYQSVEQFLFDKINQTPMDERGKQYCAYGTLHEDDAEAAFGAYLDKKVGKTNLKGWTLVRWRVQHVGLYVCKKAGFSMLGMSPDGILHTTWAGPTGGELKLKELVEYKCPATWEKKRDNPKLYKTELVPKTIPPRARAEMTRDMLGADGKTPLCEGRHRIACPSYYYAQIQFGMALFKMSGIDLPRAHFVVWCPERTCRIRVERDDTYGKWLVDRLVEVWRHQYAPAIVRRLAGGDRNKRKVLEDDPATEFSGFSLKRHKE